MAGQVPIVAFFAIKWLPRTPGIIGYAYDYEQATKLRRPSPLVPPLPGEMIPY